MNLPPRNPKQWPASGAGIAKFLDWGLYTIAPDGKHIKLSYGGKTISFFGNGTLQSLQSEAASFAHEHALRLTDSPE